MGGGRALLCHCLHKASTPSSSPLLLHPHRLTTPLPIQFAFPYQAAPASSQKAPSVTHPQHTSSPRAISSDCCDGRKEKGELTSHHLSRTLTRSNSDSRYLPQKLFVICHLNDKHAVEDVLWNIAASSQQLAQTEFNTQRSRNRQQSPARCNLACTRWSLKSIGETEANDRCSHNGD